MMKVMNMAKRMLKIIVNKIIIKCINIIVMMLKIIVHKYNSNDGIEYESEDDGIEYYMYQCDSEANENNKNGSE